MNFWDYLSYSEQDEYATLTLDYWYLTKFPEKRGRVAELEALVKERMEADEREPRDT